MKKPITPGQALLIIILFALIWGGICYHYYWDTDPQPVMHTITVPIQDTIGEMDSLTEPIAGGEIRPTHAVRDTPYHPVKWEAKVVKYGWSAKPYKLVDTANGWKEVKP